MTVTAEQNSPLRTAQSEVIHPCTHPQCLCTSSYNGEYGEHCCNRCRNGLPCTVNCHQLPSEPTARVQLQLRRVEVWSTTFQLQNQRVEGQIHYPEPSAPELPPPAFAPGTQAIAEVLLEERSVTSVGTQTDTAELVYNTQDTQGLKIILITSILCYSLTFAPWLETIWNSPMGGFLKTLDTPFQFTIGMGSNIINPATSVWPLYLIIATLIAILALTLRTGDRPFHLDLHYHRP